jgi:hypothetical protein
MAELDNTQRTQIWRGLMRYWSSKREIVNQITKADLKAAVDATDTWIDSNTTNFNNTLPEVFRTNATQAQKSLLIAAVVLMRYDIEFIKNVFGEVD